MQKPQDTMIGMNGRPPKRTMILWIPGILIGIAYTLNAYPKPHHDLVRVLLGIGSTGVWIIRAILVWHRELVEFWLRIRGKDYVAN